MLQLKTHFEQVPLKTVRKIVAEQIRREQAAELARETNQNIQEETLVEIPESQMTSLREFLEAEVTSNRECKQQKGEISFREKRPAI